ncbi:MAG: CDC27 family protein [Dysgonomonas sp.]|nr:CDC27 family protein [Dysgonomonas sp.]
MRKKDISNLLERYEQMLISGKNVYFDADEYDELADYYDKSDDIETAKEIVKLGLSIHPNNESLMIRHVRFLTYDANYSSALHYLNSHFNGYDFEQYLLKIECLLQLGLYAEAHSLTVEVLQDEDTDIDLILSELGFIYIEAEYVDEAILYFEKSLEYMPDNIEVLNDLVYAYETKEDFPNAINTCERILDIDPYLFEGWMTLGKLYSLQGDYEKAIDSFDFSLTLDDSNINVLKLKAHCLLLSDRMEEAIETLLQCIELSQEDSTIYISLIECYISLEKYDNAYKTLLDYENKFGETAESILQKASILFFQGNNLSIKELIDKALEIDNDSYETMILSADLYLKLGELESAEDLYNKAFTMEESEILIEKLISLYIQKNEFQKAIEYQKKLLLLDNSNLAKIKLALLYLEISNKNKFEELIASFDNAGLSSFLQLFYTEESISPANDDREYLLRRVDNIYESRLLYKNIKY